MFCLNNNLIGILNLQLCLLALLDLPCCRVPPHAQVQRRRWVKRDSGRERRRLVKNGEYKNSDRERRRVVYNRKDDGERETAVENGVDDGHKNDAGETSLGSLILPHVVFSDQLTR
ncbi:hypothetical protein ACLOJK_039325 [Asimina triloba]